MQVWVKRFVLSVCVGLTAADGTGFAETLPGMGKTVHYVQGDSLGGNYVATQIVMKAMQTLGYDVKLSTMNTTLFFQAVAQGDADMDTDVNFPQREPSFRKVEKQAETVGAGLIVGGGVNGYMIDRKTALAYNITRLEQMKDPKISGLFGQDGKAELISCDPGWSCGDVVGKYETLMVDVISRVKSNRPAFFYAWSPSWSTSELVPGKDVVWLPTPNDALPPNVPTNGSALVNNVQGCAGGANPCRMAMASWNWGTVANRAFIAANPSIKALIEQVKFPLATWLHWESEIGKNGGSTMVISRLANEWLAANKLELDQWVAKASAAH
jgi:glycine betaine/proline transport system substrate-binding protein